MLFKVSRIKIRKGTQKSNDGEVWPRNNTAQHRICLLEQVDDVVEEMSQDLDNEYVVVKEWKGSHES